MTAVGKRLGAVLYSVCALVCAACGVSDGPSGPQPGLPDPAYGGGDFPQRISLDGFNRSYLVHVPASASASVPAPVLFVFHGAEQTPDQIRALAGIEQFADPEGYITVYPRGVQLGWAVGGITGPDLAGVDDVRFTRAMLVNLSATLNIDPDRIFAAGFSNGGMLMHKLACDGADIMAAVASVGATMLENVAGTCAPLDPISTLFLHGTEDVSFPWEGRVGDPSFILMGAEQTVATWAMLSSCDAVPSVELLPDVAEDGTTVELRTFTGCSAGSQLAFYVINGGGHTWPGSSNPLPESFGRTTQDIVGSREILQFFGAVSGP